MDAKRGKYVYGGPRITNLTPVHTCAGAMIVSRLRSGCGEEPRWLSSPSRSITGADLADDWFFADLVRRAGISEVGEGERLEQRKGFRSEVCCRGSADWRRGDKLAKISEMLEKRGMQMVPHGRTEPSNSPISGVRVSLSLCSLLFFFF